MPDAPPPVRETTLKTFLKDRTDMRVAEDAIELMVELITIQCEDMASRAAHLATQDDRTTILPRDIQHALEGFLAESGPPMLSPDTIRGAINGISNEAFTELLQKLRADVEAHS